MNRIVTMFLALALIAFGNAAWAQSEQVETVRNATAVLHDFVNIPENAIPPRLLSEAYGIAVIPDVLKAGFIVGGRYGEGVLSVRTADGTWSHPVFIDLAGASLGWQIGAASSDIILVFKSRRSVDEIINGQVTLGADATIAAGPVGRSASAATNLQLEAEIYSYSRSRGLFAGIALEGGVITIDAEANWRYYGEMVDSRTILQRSKRRSLPESAQRLIYTLDQYMPPVNNVGDGVINGGATGGNRGQYGNYDRTQPYAGGQVQPYAGGQTQPYVGGQGQTGTGGSAQPYNPGPAQQYGGARAGASGEAAVGGGYDQSVDGGSNYGPVYDGGTTGGAAAGSGSGQFQGDTYRGGRDNTGAGARY